MKLALPKVQDPPKKFGKKTPKPKNKLFMFLFLQNVDKIWYGPHFFWHGRSGYRKQNIIFVSWLVSLFSSCIVSRYSAHGNGFLGEKVNIFQATKYRKDLASFHFEKVHGRGHEQQYPMGLSYHTRSRPELYQAGCTIPGPGQNNYTRQGAPVVRSSWVKIKVRHGQQFNFMAQY